MDAKQKEESRKLSLASAIILAVDLFDLTGIFFLSSSTVVLKMFFEQIGRYFMLPIAAGSASILAILTWRQAHLNNYQGLSVPKAIFDTLCALALIVAVTGAFAFTALFAVAGPAVIASAFGLRSLFNVASSIYYGVQAARSNDPEKKYEYRKQAGEAAIAAFVGAGATAFVITVMLLAKPVFAIIGIFAGTFGCAFAVMKSLELSNRKPEPVKPAAVSDHTCLSTNASMTKSLHVTNSQQNAPENRNENINDNIINITSKTAVNDTERTADVVSITDQIQTPASRMN